MGEWLDNLPDERLDNLVRCLSRYALIPDWWTREGAEETTGEKISTEDWVQFRAWVNKGGEGKEMVEYMDSWLRRQWDEWNGRG